LAVFLVFHLVFGDWLRVCKIEQIVFLRRATLRSSFDKDAKPHKSPFAARRTTIRRDLFMQPEWQETGDNLGANKIPACGHGCKVASVQESEKFDRAGPIFGNAVLEKQPHLRIHSAAGGFADFLESTQSNQNFGQKFKPGAPGRFRTGIRV
jgi:hypothetical protein